MRIPLANTPVPGDAQATFAPLSSSTYDRMGEAGARVGQAIEGAASLASRIKGTLDDAAIQKASVEAHAHLAGMLNEFENGQDAQNGDPSTYAERWNDARSTFEDQQTKRSDLSNLSPMARIHYQSMMDQWRINAQMQVDHFATVKGLQNAEASYVNSFHANMAAGNMEQAVQGMRDGLERGAVKPEVGEQLIQHAPAENEYNQASKMGALNPVVTDEALTKADEKGNFVNFPHLIGDARTQLILRIHREASIWQAGNVDNLRSQIDANPNDPGVIAAIHQSVQDRKITQQAGDNLIAGINRTNLAEAKDTANVWSMRVHDFDFTVAKDPEGAARDMKGAIAGLPTALQKPINAMIDNKLAASKKAEMRVEKPVETNFFAKMKEDREENAASVPYTTEAGTKRWFTPNDPAKQRTLSGGLRALRGMTDSEVEDKFGKGVTRDQVMRVEELNYSQKQDHMRQWFAAQEPDDPNLQEKATREYQNLMRPDVNEAVSKAILRKAAAPGMVVNKSYKDASGGRAIYLGGDPSLPDAWKQIK